MMHSQTRFKISMVEKAIFFLVLTSVQSTKTVIPLPKAVRHLPLRTS